MLLSGDGKMGKEVKATILFVATTPFVVNAFLRPHLLTLSSHYHIVLCVNVGAYALLPEISSLVEVRHIPFARKIEPIVDLIAILRLLSVVRQIKPVVIHSITPKAGLLAMIVGYIVSVPHRWHTFTGQVWATRKGLMRRLLKSCDQLIVLLATKVFADSASQCRFLSDQKVVRRGGITVLGHGSIAGVDLDRFHPNVTAKSSLRDEIGTASEVCVFIFLGRIARDKGVFDLLHSFRGLATTTSNVELWVVGPNEENLLSALKREAVGCRAPIRWLGPTLMPERILAAADVLVLPSYREGFGSVIIEAAACGIPTIAYRIDGVIDAVIDGHSGLLVDLGRHNSLLDAMRRLACDNTTRQHMGHQARDRAERLFSNKKITSAWLDHYNTALSSE